MCHVTPRTAIAAPWVALLCACATALAPLPRAAAADDSDIPAAPPADAVMPTAEEAQAVLDWASEAFGGRRAPDREPAVRVECRRQDYSVLRFGQSCMETPLRIGGREFQHGLGTHANSELVLRFPAGAKAFEAFVGIDNNFDTEGQRGSARFSAELGGREVFRSPVLRGGQDALPMKVDLPPDARALTLKVDTTEDGPAYDQADWADARVLLSDGRAEWADADRRGFLETATPFSFTCGGADSAALLPTWNRAATTTQQAGRVIHEVSWSDPQSGLQVRATATAFTRYAAVEWVLNFTNTGTQDAPLLENVRALDVVARTGYSRKPAVLHRLSGDVCGEQSFAPLEDAVEPGHPVRFAPQGGRSSNGAFPFFTFQYGDEGLIAAIGWSGQWAAELERSDRGPVRLRAGMEKLRLRLHPGESIRSPRILVMTWAGDRLTAQNRWRRLLLFEYVPKQNGRPLALPFALQCFDRYVGSRPEWATEAGQLRAARAAHDVGADAHWFDAAWFEGGFPNGVGNWFCRPAAFPNGLKPVSDACHAQGLKFIVWFEPERVAPGTQLAREHPEFVFGGANGGLFKLGEPAARRWLTDLLAARIGEFGLDVYRNDFNIDPLSFWRGADAPGREGLTEIRYVEGLYALWDELRSRQPGLWIDNCASGGRRIDLETLSRSVPLWRSDTGCAPGHADWDQAQVIGLALYVPLFTSCSWEPAAYTMRSAASAGAICQFDYLSDAFPWEQARAALAEAWANRKFWYGDFYPLSPASPGPQSLVAWQLHRADLDAGIVLAFRRAASPYPALQTGLRGLKPDARYAVEFIDDARAVRRETLSGRELAEGFELRLPRRASSLLVRYRAE